MGCVRFLRYCGTIYSRPLFSYRGFGKRTRRKILMKDQKRQKVVGEEKKAQEEEED